MRTLTRLAGVATTAAVLGVLCLSATAQAAPTAAGDGQTAMTGGPTVQSQSCLIQASTNNNACFEDVGDKFHVYDGAADSASAVANWWTDYGRAGQCYNSSGAGTWSTCNYDMVEDATVFWQTCYQNLSTGGALVCTAATAVKII